MSTSSSESSESHLSSDEDAVMSDSAAGVDIPASKTPTPPPPPLPNHSVDPLEEEKRLLKEQDAGLEDQDDGSDDGSDLCSHFEEAVSVKNVSRAVKWSDTPRPNVPAYFQLELTDYQALSLEKMETAPNQASILAQDMGLGKTATALGYMCNRISRHKREFGTMNGSQHLVSVPKSVARQWIAEFKKFVSPDSGIKIKLMTDKITPQDVQQLVRGEINIVVTTPYRIMDAFRGVCNVAGFAAFAKANMAYKSSEDIGNMHRAYTDWCKSASETMKAKFGLYVSPNGLDAHVRDKRITGPFVQWPFVPNWSTFVVDEAHQIRNCGTINWRAEFCVRAVSRVLLTATPLHTSLNDIYSYLRFMRVPGLVASDVWFATGYASFDNKDTYLDGMCKNILIWMRKKDIPGLNIVPKLSFHVLSPISNPTEEKYYSEWSSMAGKFAKAATTASKQTKKDALVKVRVAILRCRQVCGAAATLPEHVRLNGFSEKDFPGIKDRKGWAGTHSSKINELVTIVRDHIKKGEKFTVVSSFVGLVNLVVERFEEEGIGCVRYVGDMNESDRASTIARFKDDPKVRVMVCSLGAGHVGLSLGWAVRAIMIDPWWNPQVLLQAENRVHRYDSEKLVKIDYLIMADTIEEGIMKIAQARLEMASAFHKASSIRELLSMKRFSPDNGPTRVGEKRRVDSDAGAAAAATGSAAPRVESLARDAEVLWLNRKKVTKTVCEECIYEATIKELTEKNTGDKAKPRAVIEEEAYAAVRLKKEAMTSIVKTEDATMVDVAEPGKDGAEDIDEIPAEQKSKKQKDSKPVVPPPPTKPKDSVTAPTLKSPPLPAEFPLAPAPAEATLKIRMESFKDPVKLFIAVKNTFEKSSDQSSCSLLRTAALEGMLKYARDLEASSAVFASLNRKSKNLYTIDMELSTHGGILKSQADSIEASKKLWDDTVLSAMRAAAIKSGKAASQSALAAFKSEIEALVSDACYMPELTSLQHDIHDTVAFTRYLPEKGTVNLMARISYAFDPILPLITATTFEEKPEDCLASPAVFDALPPAPTSERPHMIHITNAITRVAVPANGNKVQSRFALFSAQTPINRIPYLVALHYAQYMAKKGHSVFELKIAFYDDTAMARIDAGSIFTIQTADRLMISDFVPIISEGYALNKMRASIAKWLNPTPKWLNPTHLVDPAMKAPINVICPLWLHERVYSALKERSEKSVYTCNTFGKDVTRPSIEMNLDMRRIFRPWWCELTLLS